MPDTSHNAPEFSIQELLDLVRRRRWTIAQTAVFVTIVGAAAALLSPPLYRTSAKLLVETPGGLVLSQVDATSALSPLMVMRQQKSIETQLAILRSAEFNRRVRAKLQPEQARALPEVSYSSEEATSILTATAQGTVAQSAADYANTAATEYVALTRESNRQALTETREFLEGAGAKAQRDLQVAERKLLLFKTRTTMDASEEERSIRLKDAVDVEAQARQSRQELRSLNSKIAGIQRRLRTEPEIVRETRVQPNPEREAIRTQMARIKAERAVALGIYTSDSARIQDMNAQIASLEQTLAATPKTVREDLEKVNEKRTVLQSQMEELRLQRDAVASLNAQLEAAAGTKTTRVAKFAPWQVELAQIERERGLAEKTYLDYGDKLRDLNVRERAMASGATVMEAAPVPMVPVGPRKTHQVAFAAAVGLLLGLGLAVLQEFLDDRINNPDDIERLTALPALGAVPLVPKGQTPTITALPSNSYVAEAYRALRSNIGFAAQDKPIRRLQVTSAVVGEGKTTTAVNLATAMAMDGKRVILVDADLRRPRMHKLLNRPNAPGLSDVLTGLRPIEEVVQDTDIPNLRVVCSGRVPPDPAELLGSHRFDVLMESLEEQADVIIVDSPPCMPVTDPLILAARMDGVVLVLNIGQTRKAALKHTLSQLGRAKARVVGVLFNRVEPGKGYYHYYYRYYGKGYYGDEAERGARHRRNGKNSEPVLAAGEAAASRSEEDKPAS